MARMQKREREREIKNRYLIITGAASIYYNYQAVSIEQQRREAFIGVDRRRWQSRINFVRLSILESMIWKSERKETILKAEIGWQTKKSTWDITGSFGLSRLIDNISSSIPTIRFSSLTKIAKERERERERERGRERNDHVLFTE